MADPLPTRLRADQARRLIHRLAANSTNVILTFHAKERMAEREIHRSELDRILRTGDVIDQPVRNDGGEWECKIIKRLPGGRDAAAVTVIAQGQKLIVKTVEWEDIR